MSAPGEQQAGESRAPSLGLIQQLLAKPVPQPRCSLPLPRTVVPRMTKLSVSPCCCLKSSISCKGNSEHTSALRTKKASAPPARIWSRKW